MINKVIKENSAFIKWTGSKRKIANKIFQHFPSKINNYYEPFLGGGYLLYLFKKNNPNKDSDTPDKTTDPKSNSSTEMNLRKSFLENLHEYLKSAIETLDSLNNSDTSHSELEQKDSKFALHLDEQSLSLDI